MYVVSDIRIIKNHTTYKHHISLIHTKVGFTPVPPRARPTVFSSRLVFVRNDDDDDDFKTVVVPSSSSRRECATRGDDDLVETRRVETRHETRRHETRRARREANARDATERTKEGRKEGGDEARLGRMSEKKSSLSSSARRIQKELAEISLEPPTNCSAGPKGDNLYEWVSTIVGPTGA